MKASHRVGLTLIFCYLVAWFDRMAINMTLPSGMSRDLGIGPEREGWILSAFFLGYALCQVPGGMLADRFGGRKVILGALGWWSAFTALTGAMASLPAMLVTRFLFGIGEGVFPASVWKILGQWFTKKNRATANALVISAIALGPALTPLILAPVIAKYGWRACFWLLGFLGALCVLGAWRFVHSSIHTAPRVPPAEIAAFEADARSADANAERTLDQASFGQLLKAPIIWVLFSIALVFNITMYGWLNWLPSYLVRVKGLSLKGMALGASLPFMFAAVGCMSAGFISDRWFRGRRKLLVVGCQIVGGVCLWLFTRVDNVVTYMVLQSVAGFLLFMACGAIWTLPMVLLPPRLMGSGSGLINAGGQIGGFATNLLIGYYVGFRGGDYGAGFDVMLAALVLTTGLVFFGVVEKRTPALAPAAAAAG